MILQLEELQVFQGSLGLFSGSNSMLLVVEYNLWADIMFQCISITDGDLLYCRWGGGKDDKYFARLGKNVISVYETETFTLIDKKSIKAENVSDFIWSPTDSIFAWFVPEIGGGNQPARVSKDLSNI